MYRPPAREGEGLYAVTAVAADASGANSTLQFHVNVTAPPPFIESVTGCDVLGCPVDGNFTLAIRGQGFTPRAVVTFSVDGDERCAPRTVACPCVRPALARARHQTAIILCRP